MLDVGAGIGRVTKHVLVPSGFGHVDLLDSSQRFLDSARDFVGSPHLGELICMPMHEFDFGNGPWDVIWVQWAAIYLPDDDFVAFFRRAVHALVQSPSSCVILKENVLRKDGPPVQDESDASQTRSDPHIRRLLAQAGARVLHAEYAAGFPANIFPVMMYALGPTESGPPPVRDTKRKAKELGNGAEGGVSPSTARGVGAAPAEPKRGKGPGGDRGPRTRDRDDAHASTNVV